MKLSDLSKNLGEFYEQADESNPILGESAYGVVLEVRRKIDGEILALKTAQTLDQKRSALN